jgi:hypothetical protein
LTRGAIELDAASDRLAVIERELAQLRYRHDIAMSAFLFEEATALGRAIAGLDQELEMLAADLPPVASGPATATGVTPVLHRPRRRASRRR